MPPKKDAADSSNLIVGFDNKECKLLAAACISMTSPDKYDYELFSKLTGNTEGSLKKMWPPVKKKAIEAHPSFGVFLGSAAAVPKAAAPKATPKKRKVGTPDPEDANEAAEQPPDDGGASPKKKKAPAKVRAKKSKADGINAEDLKAEEARKAERERILAERIQAEQNNSDDDGDGLADYADDED